MQKCSDGERFTPCWNVESSWRKRHDRVSGESMKRRAFSIVGAIIALFGLVWFLQGAGMLPGSVMSGSQFWEIAGALTLIVGIAIVAYCLKA